jgi:hypothetical protein
MGSRPAKFGIRARPEFSLSLDNRPSEFPRELAEMAQIERVVVLGEEACRTVVAALDEVQRYAGETEACTARHARVGSMQKRSRTTLPVARHSAIGEVAGLPSDYGLPLICSICLSSIFTNCDGR